jgi:SIR2-like domain
VTPADSSLPAEFLQQLQRSRVVPFIGAGLSVSAGLPNWEHLLRELLGYAGGCGLLRSVAPEIKRAIASQQFEFAADELVNGLGDHFAEALATVLRRPDLQPSAVHRLIATVMWPAIITTNYDDLLPAAMSANIKRLTWLDDIALGAALRRAEPHLLLAHGCLDQPSTLVLTVAQYRECLRHPAYRTYLKIMCSQYTLLFLGFSFTDRDIQWLLEDLRHEFGQTDVPHFALMSSDQAGGLRRRSLRSNFNIHVLPYAIENGQHSAVERFIRSVIDHCPPDQIIDRSGGLRDLATLTNRKATLSAQEYLEQFTETCRGLARLGYARTSWVALQSALNEVKDELSLVSRLRQTLALVSLMMSDGQYGPAGQQMQEVSKLPLQHQLPNPLLCEFCECWFELGVANYQSDVPREALALARAAKCSEATVYAMEARLELFDLLHGEPSMLLKEREGHLGN